MKLITLLIFIAIVQVSAAGFAQTVTLSRQELSINQIFKEVTKQTGYTVLWKPEVLNASEKIEIRFMNASVDEVVRTCLRSKNLTYTIEEKTIVIKPAEKTRFRKNISESKDSVIISGKVTDEKGGPLPGVSIRIKGLNGTRVTNAGGEFIVIAEEEDMLLFSFIGFQTQEVVVRANSGPLVITLHTAEQALESVTVNAGILRRNRETFSGATAYFSGEQLLRVGNQNIIQSLKSLDPSLIVLENNLQGSNPNTLPSMELRGKTSITTRDLNNRYGSDPNQPLFILDGFESTLGIIYNLDMNRIASVTILKDAVSTALYGSKAANGVIVVETKRPKPGRLDINYTEDFRIEAPDLNSYNMMNATEKLEFERLAGRYKSEYSEEYQYYIDQDYYKKLAEVQRGVDTYWLSVPLHTGITSGHSIQITGGSEEFSFGAGGSYRNIGGAMKGSSRTQWGSNIDLTYRRGKINVTNSLYLSGYNSDESKYGSFATYVNTNPYYRKQNEDGTIPRYLEQSYYAGNSMDEIGNPTFFVTNPLYDVLTPGINNEKNFNLQNNFQVIYDVLPDIRVQGGLQLSHGNTTRVLFIPPENSSFDNASVYEKGSYENMKPEYNSFNGFLMATFARVLGGKHQVNANIRADISGQTDRSVGFSATGFPNGSNGNPAFAYSYTPYSRPESSSEITHRNNLLASINYAYDLRFLLDATYRLDGSTAFGSNHLYAPFWSAGIGWNLHNEKMLKQAAWVDMLTIRGNIGYTGNQNFGMFSSTSVYTNLPGRIVFGQGLDLVSLGNPDLEWQNTLQKSIGTDFAFWNNRVSGSVNYFNKKTDPLVIGDGTSFAPSTGLSSGYPVNAGALTVKGWEASIRVSPVYNLSKKIIWSIGILGSANKSRYSGFGKALDSFNQIQKENSGLIRFYDGYSPDDIWAVISRGIDPANGMELFQKKDGSLTYEYNVEDVIKAGNTRPKVEGVINTSFSYKAFNAGINLRYRLGGYVFNTALYNKIEGITQNDLKNNLDKRALYDRWQKPGDVSSFRSLVNISDADNSLNARNPSSRFIQKDNNLTGESLSIGWDFTEAGWLSKVKVRSLRLNFFLNEFFRLESVLSERGIDYPFTRNVSFSINAFF